MKDAELLVLPHTLTWHGQGGMNIASDARSQMSGDEQEQVSSLEMLLSQLMLMPRSLAQWQRTLSALNDNLAVPETLAFVPWTDDALLAQLSPEQKRVYQVFQQLLQDERKSTRYYDAFVALCQHYPEEETLWHMKFAYDYRWRQGPGDELQSLLVSHPHWLFLRLLAARESLKEDEFLPAVYQDVLAQRLLLHEHLQAAGEDLVLTDLLVYQFHLDVFMFFSLTGQLERAAFAFWQAHEACSVPEALYPLSLFVLATCEKGPEDPRFVSFAQCLQKTAALKV
jgi:hypothetical protein